MLIASANFSQFLYHFLTKNKKNPQFWVPPAPALWHLHPWIFFYYVGNPFSLNFLKIQDPAISRLRDNFEKP